MPILSPLICMDKIEIENVAKSIGTYETSIIPDSGCAAVPKHPETHADMNLFMDIVENINQKNILEDVSNTFKRID